MHADPVAPQADLVDLLADLSEAAYGFVLRHGFRGTFVEVELGLWDALRARQGGIQEFVPTGLPSDLHIPVPPPTRQGTIDEAAPAFNEG
jgi:hypothetical protein